MENNLPETIGDIKSLHLAKLTKEDLDFHLELLNNPEIQKTLTNSEKDFKMSKLEKEFEKMSEPKPTPITYSIKLGDKVIGRTKLQNINWDAKNSSSSSVISPEYQGKGYGTLAAQLRIELAKSLGIKTMYARIHSDNKPNIRIHEKLEYEVVGNLSDYAIGLDGKLVDALIYQKKL